MLLFFTSEEATQMNVNFVVATLALIVNGGVAVFMTKMFLQQKKFEQVIFMYVVASTVLFTIATWQFFVYLP